MRLPSLLLIRLPRLLLVAVLLAAAACGQKGDLYLPGPPPAAAPAAQQVTD